MLGESAAEMASEASGQLMGGDTPSCSRREVPDVNGSYVFGELLSLEVTYTVDNGASDTTVNPQVYRGIPEDVWPKLFQAGWWVEGTGGKPIKIWGQASFDLQLGPVSLQRVLMVAETEDQILLGDGILRRDPEVPTGILNTEKVMVFQEASDTTSYSWRAEVENLVISCEYFSSTRDDRAACRWLLASV